MRFVVDCPSLLESSKVCVNQIIINENYQPPLDTFNYLKKTTPDN